MSYFIQNAITAASLGGLFALVALGLALIFGIMRLINFAHGELIMAGGYVLAYLTFQTTGVPWPAVVLITLLAVAALALLVERVAFRPVRGASPATLLITSFAVSYGLQNLARLALTPQGNLVPIVFPPGLSESFAIGEFKAGKIDIITVITTVALLVGLILFFARSRLGLEMRASAENFLMARMLGVRANMVIGAAFALSGLLAAVVSILYLARFGGVLPTSGLAPLLIGLVAIVIGGMGSLAGAAFGGYFLGTTLIMLQAYLPADIVPFRTALVYAAVIVVLLFRPQGIFVAKGAVARV